MNFKEYFHYTEKLLNAQSDVAEIIEHLPTRGKVREYFIKEIIEKHFGSIKVHRGVVNLDNEENEGQIDLILTSNDALIAAFTPEDIGVNAEDCKMVIEVKTNATSADIEAYNKRAKIIKQSCLETSPLCGMFCYKIDILKTTLLERFGYIYDEDAKMYLTYQELDFKYPFIDFFVCIDQSEFEDFTGSSEFFLRKDTSEFSDGSYDLSENLPALKDFLKMIKGILRQ
jgi:hypothetical protein